MKLLLASSSPYRKSLLARLNLSFSQASPDIDETVLPGENARSVALRLSEQKARALAHQHPDTLIIASDQTASLGNLILGKPGSEQKAMEQLSLCNGRHVTFHTGLCLLNTGTDHLQVADIEFHVWFRQLSPRQIEHYIKKERPLDCAGSFKCEGLGIALFERMAGDDPNSLIGLPLISLTGMLLNEGIDILTQPS